MSRRLAVVATALGTVAAGLVSGATVHTANAAGDSPTQTARVLVRANHTIVMPTELRPGVTEFKISSRRDAGFQIAQAAPGYTKREAMRDINAAFNQNNMKALERFEANVTLMGGMPSTAEKSASMRVRLTKGTYWALDSMPRRLDPAKVLTFTVGGKSVGGLLSGYVIRATGVHTWGNATSRIPTKGRIVFRNPSEAPHFLEIARLAEGKTMADFEAWMEELKKGNETPPPVDFQAPSINTGVISTGRSMSLKYRLPAGSYVLLCWWPDPEMGGMPHAMMGMYRGLEVG